MQQNFDAIVVGCGGMGSSTAYHLATRGIRTLVLERFALNHTRGSSHGFTRIIRYMYDYPWCIPLVKRASELWLDLEKESGKRIMMTTGGLFVAPADHEIMINRMRYAKLSAVPYELMASREIEERFPVFNVPEGDAGLFDPHAGILFPESCIETHVKLAEERGAEFHFAERALKCEMSADDGGKKVVVRTSKNSYTADHLIISAGSWTGDLVADLNLPLTCERQVVFWMKPVAHAETFKSTRMPVFGWFGHDRRNYYGIPDVGNGVKVAEDHHGGTTLPYLVDRRVTEKDERPIRNFIKDHIPLLDGDVLSSVTCLYTNTPDGQFLLDFHPRHRNILLVSPCSGHGFKFSSVIGEIAADLVEGGSTPHDISHFTVNRLLR